MGLLDDAIREHLELKRRHGADASEIARLENEVLGSGATAPAPVAEAPAEVELNPQPLPPEPEPEPAPDLDFSLEAEEVEINPQPLPPEPQPEPQPEHRALEEPAEPAHEEPVEYVEEYHTESYVDPGQPTVAFSLEEQEDAERPREPDAQDSGEHDELEDTPDFLQETPEHDRMWFEQKPPKDFDF
jgi:hypothetical protein